VFPIRDENPQILVPVVTWGLIAANVAAWVLVQGAGLDESLVRSVCHLGLVPGELLDRLPAGSSIDLGGHACIVGGPPAPWTLLTHMFLHGGWMHLLGNMWFLYLFGGNVEDSMGHLRFLVFYLLSGLAAAAAQILAAPAAAIPMVGASGAIGGVMGAYVVLYPRVWVHMLVWIGFYVGRVAVPAYFMLGYWLLLQLIGGATSLGDGGGGVAFWAHVGGFVVGAGLGLAMRNRAFVARHPYHGWRRPAARPSWDRHRRAWR